MHFHFLKKDEPQEVSTGWVYRFNFTDAGDQTPGADKLPPMSQFSQGSWEAVSPEDPKRPDYAQMQTGADPHDLMCFIEELAEEIGADVVEIPRAPTPIMSSALSLHVMTVGTEAMFGFIRFPKVVLSGEVDE